jgi:hypothetical protein
LKRTTWITLTFILVLFMPSAIISTVSAKVADLSSPGPSGSSYSPTVVTNTTNPQAIFLSYERKVFFAQDHWWVFYSDGVHFVYRTSTDGISWNSPTILASGGYTQSSGTFSTWVRGNTFYYVTVPTDVSFPGNFFLYRYGTFNSDGTIRWEVPETSAPTSYSSAFEDSITIDNSGNMWVAVNTLAGTNNLEVYRHSNSTNTWSMVRKLSGSPGGYHPLLLSLTSRVALVYGTSPTVTKSSMVNITTTGNGGVTWSPVVSPPTPS